ncbi:hypothetical protein [Noviherbaspirillum pedocola]|uniref:Uncharacterized protein n=1 Tax=Noviherbaspirillum pedocola TaxID=2801341 RepID=A0A934W7P6_9BURK|nr:hypothetical protein [Noviherbaspirillum pedocola]MBK4734919.1 hypothetical protein [Noviherbaspirillum pedocola]
MSAPDFLIKNCPGSSSSSRCPTSWSRLKTSFSDAVRHCNGCNRKVYLCLNDQDLKFYSSLKYPIAVDSPDTEAALAQVDAMPVATATETSATPRSQALPPVAETALAAAPSVWRRPPQMSSENVLTQEDVENLDDMPAFMRCLTQAR